MTPAIKTVEAAGIAFSLHEYEPDLDAEAYGLDAAAKIGVSPERVFKTLVARLDGKELVLAIIPVAERLDLKKLAAVCGLKKGKADLADPTAAERTTGYVVGGISPLGGRRKLRTILHDSVLSHSTVYVSAGRRGLQLELSPADLVGLTDGVLAAITVLH